MRKLSRVILLPAGLMSLSFAATVLAAGVLQTIYPGTREAEQAIASLEHAEQMDRLNAQGYTSPHDSDVGTFYLHKADEAKDLARELERGQPVFSDDVADALDNSQALRYGPNY